MSTILTTIKKTIGISELDTSFDVDILMHINATLMILSQIGLKEADRMPMISSDTTWEEFLGGRNDLEAVKTYIHFRVKNMFDPPTNTAGLEANNKLIAEFEWRIANLELNKGGE